MEIIY